LRILVVEDEAKVARALQEGLEREEYTVVVARTGEEGFYLVSAEEFDLVILDLMLPGRDGLEVLSTLRKRGLVTPVLILTARDAIEDRVQGLDKGGDDYLVKPFAFPELSARIRALLRRGRTQQVTRLQLADLEMDLVVRRVRRGGKNVEFTPREFELLEYLLRHKEQVVSREMLARATYGGKRQGPHHSTMSLAFTWPVYVTKLMSPSIVSCFTRSEELDTCCGRSNEASLATARALTHDPLVRAGIGASTVGLCRGRVVVPVL